MMCAGREINLYFLILDILMASSGGLRGYDDYKRAHRWYTGSENAASILSKIKCMWQGRQEMC